LDDTSDGTDVIVSNFSNTCFCLLTHSACNVSRRLFNLFHFMLSAVKIFIQSKHFGLSSPSTSIFVKPTQRHFVSYFMHTVSLLELVSLFFHLNQLHYLYFFLCNYSSSITTRVASSKKVNVHLKFNTFTIFNVLSKMVLYARVLTPNQHSSIL